MIHNFSIMTAIELCHYLRESINYDHSFYSIDRLNCRVHNQVQDKLETKITFDTQNPIDIHAIC